MSIVSIDCFLWMALGLTLWQGRVKDSPIVWFQCFIICLCIQQICFGDFCCQFLFFFQWFYPCRNLNLYACYQLHAILQRLDKEKKIMYIIQAKRLNYSLSQHAQQKGHGQWTKHLSWLACAEEKIIRIVRKEKAVSGRNWEEF